LYRGFNTERTIADFEDASLDYIFSSHCLEHISNWEKELENWYKKIRSGGLLFLYLPHPECEIWHPGSPFVGNGHKWIPTFSIVREGLMKLGGEIVSLDEGPDAMFSFHLCLRKA